MINCPVLWLKGKELVDLVCKPVRGPKACGNRSFCLKKKKSFCEEELLTGVRIYRFRSCACISGVQVITSKDVSYLSVS